jgi:hypothetical protein
MYAKSSAERTITGRLGRPPSREGLAAQAKQSGIESQIRLMTTTVDSIKLNAVSDGHCSAR